MIETEQSAIVEAGIADVWAYVEDIRRWATIMPGYQECTLIDAFDSLWTLKVGVGGLVRTVKVNVHIDEWAGPESVRFTFKLTGDPVQGGGTYTATALSPTQTEIALKVNVVGSGPMAPMWEAMGKPLLPKFAKSFAEQLRDAIEKTVSSVSASTSDGPADSAEPVDTLSVHRGGRAGWLRALWRKLFG